MSRYAASRFRGRRARGRTVLARLGLAAVCLGVLALVAPEAAPRWTVPDAVRADDAAIWVAPDGSDGATGTVNDPFRTPERARRAVREVVADGRGATVNLEGGTYRLTGPLRLGPEDSAPPGRRVTWRSAPGERAVLSGGRPVDGWQRYAAAGQGVWRARVEPGVRSRQLYVDGRRAIRARAELDQRAWRRTGTGYRTDDPAVAALAGAAGATDAAGATGADQVEAVSMRQWKGHRCPLRAVSDEADTDDGGYAVTMAQPCFGMAVEDRQPETAMGNPDWLENSLAFLDRPREWYLDTDSGWLYYRPADGESPAGAEFVLPVAEKLLTIAGTPQRPVRGVHVEDLTFAHATWNQPSAPDGTGYVNAQAGHFRTPKGMFQVPAAVTLRNTRDVVFDAARFTRLGAHGLELLHGAQHTTVSRSEFADISGSGIAVSAIDGLAGPGPESYADPARPEDAVRDNRLADNVVEHVGREYFDASGIFVGYAAGTTVEHNLVAHTSYTGISVGWGWSRERTVSRDIAVVGNRIVDTMRVLLDGGAIYTLGAMPGTTISDNLMEYGQRGYAGLYLDQGSDGIRAERNVVRRSSGWLLANMRHESGDPEYDVSFTDTWTDTPVALREDAPVADPIVVHDEDWPPGAREVMARAGPRTGVGIEVATPAIVRAGEEFSVVATVGNDDAHVAERLAVTLDLPAGWTTRPTPSSTRPGDAVDLAPGARRELRWTVRAPDAEAAQPGDVYPTVRARFTTAVPAGPGGRSRDRQPRQAIGWSRVDTPYPALSAASRSAGVAPADNPPAGDFLRGSSYSAEELRSAGVGGGGSAVPGWPADDAVVLAHGQVIASRGRGEELVLVGAGTEQDHHHVGTLGLRYADGSRANRSITLPSWVSDADPPDGVRVLAETTGHTGVDGRRQRPTRLYAVHVPLDADRTLETVRLPEQFRLRLFTMLVR